MNASHTCLSTTVYRKSFLPRGPHACFARVLGVIKAVSRTENRKGFSIFLQTTNLERENALTQTLAIEPGSWPAYGEERRLAG